MLCYVRDEYSFRLGSYKCGYNIIIDHELYDLKTFSKIKILLTQYEIKLHKNGKFCLKRCIPIERK